jgi:hypothetical protein
MDARIVHFGFDDCHRLMVLRGAGYSVEECTGIVQLSAVLSGSEEVDAVVFAENDGDVPRGAILLIRTKSTAPVILFESKDRNYGNSEIEFDLVVPAVSNPAQWLRDVERVVEQSLRRRWKSAALTVESHVSS